ncbi:MAG: CAP domain-containing protein [Desulfovermiculus sp.]|nr:CAP domain-containing protein [Desulfovermiculus sp.]
MYISLLRITCTLLLIFVHSSALAAGTGAGAALPRKSKILSRLSISCGQTRTSAADDMDWLADQLADCGLLLGNMEPLNVDPRLAQAAQEKAVEILTLDYFSHISPDGLTPAERLTEHGYRVFDSAQSLAVISFRNYMSPERALKLLLQNILADETGKGQIRKLLNPVFKDIGVSHAVR